ncbi:MAG: hypothetical protein M5R36_09660 [Deltaproteobacteria bacterium]|nr:hypothetical protein [Deltaproteobacteria bacterium]
MLLVFGYLILAGLAARWRAGTNYPAPMIVLAFMFAILAWEAAAAADTSLLGVAKILHRLFPTT